jgi:hypothetical protein
MKKDVSITCPNCGAALFKNEQCAYCRFETDEIIEDVQEDVGTDDTPVCIPTIKSCICPRCKKKLLITTDLEGVDFLKCDKCGKNFFNPIKRPNGALWRVLLFIASIISMIINNNLLVRMYYE